jgi:hypothetical protein
LALVAAIGKVSRLLSVLLPATALGRKDRVVLFTTAGRLSADGSTWRLPLHGWVHEPEREDPLRNGFVALLVGFLGLGRGSPEARVLSERLGWFLVDNKRKRLLTLALGQRKFTVGPSDLSGHFREEVSFSVNDLATSIRDEGVEVDVVSPHHPPRTFLGQVLLVAPTGLSVLSDVDDTVKVSNVLDKKALLQNTFMKPFQPAPGMAEFFQHLADRGAAFHFVSCSPWHLYPPLKAFLDANGFPKATLNMKRLRLKDSSLYEFVSPPEAFKVPQILALLQAYPRRQFVLIGDSGERDPEVYGQIARERPDQVVAILIRNVSNESATSPRWELAFRDVPPERWQLFTTPSEIASLVN